MDDSDIFSEDDVIEKIILPMLVRLGYDIESTEIKREYHIPVGTTEVSADIVIMRSDKPSFVIDGKNPRANLDSYETQILSYGALLKVKFGVLCNGVNIRCYDIENEKLIWNKSISTLPIFLNKQNMIKTKSGKISKSQTETAKKVLFQIEGTKQFSKLLYKCEDLIRDNDGLTGESAFDEMSKMLFMKMWYEKTNKGKRHNQFSLENIRDEGGAKYVRDYLFQEVKGKNPDLITKDDTLKISDETIIQIVAFFDDYTLLDTDIDVKGEAFEVFLGRTLTGDLGQFFTPRTVVNFTVDMVEPKINSKHGHPYLVLDPSCGTGGFLISTFMRMCDKIHSMPKPKRDELTKRLAEKQIFGVDVNPRLARVAKMNMFLHGDGHGGIYAANGLLDPTNEKYEGKFDLIVTNPPFGNKDDKSNILKSFILGNNKKRQLREILFVERCIKCLRGGGCLAIVLPDGILNNSRMQYVRDFIKEHMIIDVVVALPVRSFKAVGANSKTSVVFMHKKHKSNEKQTSIFMAKAQEIGFDRKTKIAKKININDLDTILSEYKKYIKKKSNLKKTSYKILCNDPPCFVINQELTHERLDAAFFYAEYIFEIRQPFCRVKDVATISCINANLNENPDDEIQYIEFSSIDKHVGDITHTTTHSGHLAPNRAKYRVTAGDVVCARMLDSEKNVAIIPNDLDQQVATNGFVILRPKKPMTSESLFAMLRKNTTTDQVRWRAAGTIMPSVTDDDYMNIKIPILTKAEISDYTEKISKFNQVIMDRQKYLKGIF